MYTDFGQWLTNQLGQKVQKISVNAGFTCPNRDGTVGTGGCTYCNNQTFNPSYCATEKTITQQLEEGKQFFARKYPTMKYLAYFQAYTNTYSSFDTLREKYEEALRVEDVVGIVIGTRPDCVSEELLDYLAELHKRSFVLVEYGIESTDDSILRDINRGHTFAQTQWAVCQTAQRGIPVGGHIILNLPRTHTIPHYIEMEAERLSALPITTLKIHQLQLIRGTIMAEEYEQHPERFRLYTVDEYIDLVIEFISHLRPDIVLERFVSQSPQSLLAVPGWGLKNHEFTAKLRQKLIASQKISRKS